MPNRASPSTRCNLLPQAQSAGHQFLPVQFLIVVRQSSDCCPILHRTVADHLQTKSQQATNLLAKTYLTRHSLHCHSTTAAPSMGNPLRVECLYVSSTLARSEFAVECRRLDSNQHALAGTGPQPAVYTYSTTAATVALLYRLLPPCQTTNSRNLKL